MVSIFVICQQEGLRGIHQTTTNKMHLQDCDSPGRDEGFQESEQILVWLANEGFHRPRAKAVLNVLLLERVVKGEPLFMSLVLVGTFKHIDSPAAGRLPGKQGQSLEKGVCSLCPRNRLKTT